LGAGGKPRGVVCDAHLLDRTFDELLRPLHGADAVFREIGQRIFVADTDIHAGTNYRDVRKRLDLLDRDPTLWFGGRLIGEKAAREDMMELGAEAGN